MNKPVNTNPWKITGTYGDDEGQGYLRYRAYFKTKKSAFGFARERLDVTMFFTRKITERDIANEGLDSALKGKWEIKYRADQYDPLYLLNNMFLPI